MTFNEFINAINNCFQNFFTHIIDIVSPLFENNFIKLIICLALFSFIIYLFFEIFNILYTILNNKHDKEEQIKMIHPEESKKSSSKNKNGDNFKKKDIYW